ncbi:MAG: transglycosylase domain-containing protein, partial [Rikenellaceae bacterium]
MMLYLTAIGSFGRLPSFEELENPKSNLATEIFSDDGVLLGTFFIENRSYLPYEELFPADSTQWLTLNGIQTPPIVAALISTEDERYREHGGVDIESLYRVGVKTIMLQSGSQGGGSTISQQLAKNLFPRDTTLYSNQIARFAKLVSMKFKEWITAVKLERNYTKEEIVAMYLNTVTYGSNSYGIKAAAETFFGKTPDQLNIQESAVLVGLVNAPTKYSPVRNPKSSLARRNVVLSRMAGAGSITQSQLDSLKASPIELNYKPITHNDGSATYFREMLRLTMNQELPQRKQFRTKWDYDQALKEYNQNPIVGWCHKNSKADGTPYNIYRDGLRIYTTIDSKMQLYAEEAMQKQMESVIQPMMDAQKRSSGTIFVDAPSEYEEQTIYNAMRYADRYFHLKEAGYDHEQIMQSYEDPREMKVFTFKGLRDTLMTPRDSILHYKSIL